MTVSNRKHEFYGILTYLNNHLQFLITAFMSFLNAGGMVFMQLRKTFIMVNENLLKCHLKYFTAIEAEIKYMNCSTL